MTTGPFTDSAPGPEWACSTAVKLRPAEQPVQVRSPQVDRAAVVVGLLGAPVLDCNVPFALYFVRGGAHQKKVKAPAG